MKRVDVKFTSAGELETLAFIDAEVARLAIKGGRAAYLLQLARATMLASQGDTAMYQAFGAGAPPPPQSRQSNDDVIDKMTGDMFQ